MARVGGICGIIVAILSIAAGSSYLVAPEVQKGPGPIYFPGPMLASFAQDSTAIMVHYWVLALVPLAVIAVMLAMSDLVRSVSDGWARWATALGIVSAGIQAANYLLAQSYVPLLAANYAQADAATKAAIEAMGPRWIDPQFWMSFGVSGLWLVVINVLALRGAKMPRGLAWVGIVCGVSYWLIPGGFVFRFPAAVALAAGLVGIVLAPVWWGWTGIFLTKKSTAAS
jgi:hypothetical protein